MGIVGSRSSSPVSDVLQLGVGFRTSGPPLPELIASLLRDAVLGGRLGANQRLPAEPELAEQLKVSRATLRHAVSILIQEGLLVRRRGIGTFVSSVPSRVLRGGLTDLTSTTELIRRQGYTPGTEGLETQTSKAPAGAIDIFGQDPESAFFHITRTRLADGVPVIHCEEFVPYSVLTDTNFKPPPPSAQDWSLYEALSAAGITPTVAECRVIPVLADKSIAKRLRLRPGQPVLLLKQVHYAASGEPVLYCENWHNTELIEFQVVRR